MELDIKFNREASLAHEIVVDAIQLIAGCRRPRRVSWKSNNAGNREVVTDVDIEVNDYVNSKLHEAFPRDSVLGEESGPVERRSLADRLWLVDPIDGTRSFIDEKWGCSTIISFVENGHPVFSVVGDIKSREVFAAFEAGVFESMSNQKTTRIAQPPAWEEKLIWNPYSDNKMKQMLVREFNLCGEFLVESLGLRAVSIAKGRGKMFVSSPGNSMIWDTAPVWLVIRAMSGDVTDFDGQALEFNPLHPVNENGVIATAGMQHGEAVRLINRHRN